MTDWSSCPSQAGPARDAWILAQIEAGDFEVPLQQIEVQAGGHTGVFTVFADALKVGGVRINVSADLQQRVADMLSGLLLTPRLADLVWQNRSVWLDPMPRPITSSTAAMIEQSEKIEAAIGSEQGQPVNTVGKHWTLVKSIFSESAKAKRKAANYGWHFEGSSFQGIKGEPTVSLPGVRVIQGVGTVHDISHTDYSQICQLALRACKVDGEDRDLADIYTDPDLSVLVSHEGPLPGWRQPGSGEASAPVPVNVVIPNPGPGPGPAPAPSEAQKKGSGVAKVLAGAAALAALVAYFRS